MEQTLREHDRDFVARVDHGSHRLEAAKTARWSVLGIIAGFVLLLTTFRFNVALGAVGFLLMLASTLAFAQHLRAASTSRTSRRTRTHGFGNDWSEMRRRMRSRFGHHD